MDADSLRDRIADIIYQNCEADGYTKLSTAQAVIDDLGLTMERKYSYVAGLRDENGILISEGMATRVVGKWEEEK
ncbi:hypothetical protein GCM10009700_27800 [Brevibacterium sanguinis]|uniref:hypothetical protein n=1 Tax=Brevibacterium sanguinis TaxID=232444 RepID=UPI0031DD237F